MCVLVRLLICYSCGLLFLFSKARYILVSPYRCARSRKQILEYSSIYSHKNQRLAPDWSSARLCFAARDVVINDGLKVFVSLDVYSARVVPRRGLWIHVDNLAIPFVLEQKPTLIVGDDLEVGGCIVR